MIMRRVIPWLLAAALSTPVIAWADGPIDEAKAIVAEGRELLEKAEQTRGKKKPVMLAEGLRKYARAYLLITSRKLENDAPDLLQEISDKIKQVNEVPEIVSMRQELQTKAIVATEEGRLTEAYDHFASLRDIDPRKWTVEYALTVIGQRMEGG